jgi:hypothetical protein
VLHRYDVRASDHDRERAVEFLKAHYADGRLRDDELAWRSDAAYRAVGLAELDRLTADLPALARPPRRRRRPLLTAALICALLVALLVVVPPEAWVLMLALLIPLAMVACFVVAPIAIPVLVLAWIVHVVVRAARPQPPRHVGWR